MLKVLPVNEPVPEVIEFLEARLAEARSGDIVAVSAATVNRAGFTGYGFGYKEGVSLCQLLGSTAYMQSKLVQEMAKGAVNV